MEAVGLRIWYCENGKQKTAPPCGYTPLNMREDFDKDHRSTGTERSLVAHGAEDKGAVALLTGGDDKPYVYGLTMALLSHGVAMDLIGSDELDCPEFQAYHKMNFLNLRGSQRPNASFLRKAFRISVYYARLLCYAATAKPKIFHILWHNRFQAFDRTVLMLYYRLLGKRIVLTAHNVNAGIRDSNDTWLNRFTLRSQYRLSDHIFVHTKKMELELLQEYGVPPSRVTVIPFGINNSIPNTSLTPSQARQQLGVGDGEKAILFFGNIAPYKGLEYLTAAFQQILARCGDYKLIIAGSPFKSETYWAPIREAIEKSPHKTRVLIRDKFIPDDETEIYFKAADVFVLPYRYIDQSGVLFLGHSFGLPVIAADVGCLKDEIVEGETGFVVKPEDPVDLARAIERYFASDLYAELDSRRPHIRHCAITQHSWDLVSQATMSVYADLVGIPYSRKNATNTLPLNPNTIHQESSATSSRVL
jgi:glycosyltransferase involved in cell wall biosynthesis